nr:hypothetical protein Iba_chr05aCG9280 [Ipomoea batatas]GMC93934.1 hypothetical protein Iba_chr05bCG7160 [Ipomoea batatas]GMD48160.1 hypothetical protein Iba_scaffold1349991CG0010 [Ipomoea batatas]GMD83582.1 hypothetical protein Iba_chr14aCG6500 [Ipomoea batatas]GME03141.1 hypothetical protein Iba_scaffold489CG0210 [Ipomoea batatas]
MESCKAEESILLQQPTGRSTTAAATTSTGRSEPLTCRRPSVTASTGRLLAGQSQLAKQSALGSRNYLLYAVGSSN